MNASVDSVGVQTWPLVSAAAATATPLPAEAKASPHPSPLPQAGEGVTSSPLPPLPLAGEGRGAGKPGAGENRMAATPAEATASATTQATTPPSFGEPTGAAGAVGGTVLALLLVVAVILALAWLAKRMPGFGSASGVGNQSLKIVGSLALGPRERVVVVAVGETQLLLSTGPHGTRALHTLEQPLPVAAASPSPFAQVLAQQFGRKTS